MIYSIVGGHHTTGVVYMKIALRTRVEQTRFSVLIISNYKYDVIGIHKNISTSVKINQTVKIIVVYDKNNKCFKNIR